MVYLFVCSLVLDKKHGYEKKEEKLEKAAFCRNKQ